MEYDIKIIFLAGLFPNEKREEIIKDSKGVVQNAADNLQWSIVKGLERNKANFVILNLPYIGSFPKRYRKVFSKSYRFSHNSSSVDYNVGFVNLPIFKSFSRFFNTTKVLSKLVNRDEQKKVILIYAMHTPFVKAAIKIKNKNPNIRIVLIVPDLPEHMGEDKSIFRKIYTKLNTYFLYKKIPEIDGFVLLSQFMKKPLNIKDKPYTIVEGIFDNYLEVPSVEKEKEFIILYTGTLAKRYGVIKLLESFSKIENSNFRLWICGDGEGKQEIQKASLTDKRIIYFGQVPFVKILELQKKATVLINPRAPEAEYTKYSFPSKIMEYLASGTPTILYKLQGIPEEYSNYCFLIDEKDPDGLVNKILEVYRLPDSEKELLGNRAKLFIFDKKNPEIQTLKIIELINALYN